MWRSETFFTLPFRLRCARPANVSSRRRALFAVPPGTYAVFGRVMVGMNSTNCFLSFVGDGVTDGAVTGNTAGDSKNDTLTMMRTTTLTFTEDMTLMCSATTNTALLPAYATDAKILALKIASKDIQDGAP